MVHRSQGEELRWLPRALPEKGKAALLQAGATALGGAVHTRARVPAPSCIPNSAVGAFPSAPHSYH